MREIAGTEIRSRYFEESSRALRNWVEAHFHDPRTLLLPELGSYRERCVVAGWEVSVQFSDKIRRLHLLIDNLFPRTAAQVALIDRPDYLTWPHVNKDGVLCILPDIAEVDPALPAEATANIFGQACTLIEELIAGQRQEDFRDEFNSYWSREAIRGVPFYSLCAPRAPSRLISVWRGQQFYLLGDDESQLLTWLKHFASDESTKRKTGAGILIWLPKPLIPTEYPRTGKMVRELALQSECSESFERLLSDGSESAIVLLGMESVNGPCFAGITLGLLRESIRPNGRRTDQIGKGFRAGKVPKELMTKRVVASERAILSVVERVDASWIHGRDHAPEATRLRNAKVAILGCGSVGSGVAELLAQAGVGEFMLVDPERLSWANVGRHVLGVDSVHGSKSEKLAASIKTRFPHIIAASSFEAKWSQIPQVAAEALRDCDLIVSAIGSWSAEGELNEWHIRGRRLHPIVYGWTEPHACAGHAVAIMKRGGCFQCGMTVTGSPKLRVTRFDHATTRNEPACGVVFQPFGPIELAHTITLVSELAVDCLLGNVIESTRRVWAGRRVTLEKVGGRWSDDWLAIAQGKQEGGFVETMPWVPDANCIECGGGSE